MLFRLEIMSLVLVGFDIIDLFPKIPKFQKIKFGISNLPKLIIIVPIPPTTFIRTYQNKITVPVRRHENLNLQIQVLSF